MTDGAHSGGVGTGQWFGIAPYSANKLIRVFERWPGLETVWIYGSRARGDHRNESDIDLAVNAPEGNGFNFTGLRGRIEDLGLIYRVDVVHYQNIHDAGFRSRIERDRKVFWEPRRQIADIEILGSTHLKPFQTESLNKLGRYIEELQKHEEQALAGARALKAAEIEVPEEISDFPKKTWAALKEAGLLPPAFAEQPYSSRFDGARRAIPNLCLKVPTGGGKTLLAAASVARVFSAYRNRHTGLVLWVVPNDAIYRQTLKTLSDRDHPYRQMLNVAGAGKVKILEKNSPLTRMDVDTHLCVMLLMLQSAARQSKETLRFFRDRGNVLGFLPAEYDIEAHWNLLQRVPNLDVYAPWGASAAESAAQKGSVAKTSLGNVMRLVRPMVVIDEGHHAYTENALHTIDGFNPCFMLELSATPRVSSARGGGSNILVDVRGTDLDEAEMIKLPIHVDVKHWNDWQSCLSAAVGRLETLQKEAEHLHEETARYIRPILLVQVERTRGEFLDAGFIHAEHARAYLLQIGFNERQIAIKTSDKDELKQPENIDLLSPTCEVRAIITKQALQEGWDCPFAYVLCALAAGRNPAAMTQLVGRILRQPQVTKTGREALDACYVLCHDARTADVVKGIKKSLETEGMGDLAISVTSSNGDASAITRITQQRRAQFANVRIFVPKVSWVETAAPRRELVYDSDILARLPWHELNVEALATNWAPDASGARAQHLAIDLSILTDRAAMEQAIEASPPSRLDRALLVRALLDLAPNAWLVWEWVDAVVRRLLAQGYDEGVLADSSASLTERLRVDVELERDRLAQTVFDRMVADGQIEFCLRADAADYELPSTATLDLSGTPASVSRPDARAVEKSLLEPAVRPPDMNDFEVAFAGYLDQKAALRWWHRNVAKTQYGLQGWKRNKVYPDFVFALVNQDGRSRTVLMETKGIHLKGSGDTQYKQALLERLTEAFKDQRLSRAGELVLTGAGSNQVICDLVFDEAWQGAMELKYFSTERKAE